MLAVVILTIPLYNVISHYPDALERRQLDVADEARRALSGPLPEGAMLAGDWRDVTPLRYMQRVEGQRPDLWIVATDAIGINMLARRAIEQDAHFYVIRPTTNGIRLLPLPVWDATIIAHPEEGRLANGVHWRGYDLTPAQPRAGDTLHLTLYWYSETDLEQDWVTFIHLLDAQGEKVAQVDEVAIAPYYPPSQWQPGILLAAQHELSLPASLLPGRYRLVFGWYAGEMGRLDWIDEDGPRMLAELVLRPPG